MDGAHKLDNLGTLCIWENTFLYPLSVLFYNGRMNLRTLWISIFLGDQLFVCREDSVVFYLTSWGLFCHCFSLIIFSSIKQCLPQFNYQRFVMYMVILLWVKGIHIWTWLIHQVGHEVTLLENNLDYVFCFPIINSVHLVVKLSFQSIIALDWNHTHGSHASLWAVWKDL